SPVVSGSHQELGRADRDGRTGRVQQRLVCRTSLQQLFAVPSPLMMVAHCAAKTTRIRLGSAVCILPLYQPARFLAEVGLVDVLSDGRLELGIGSGYQQFEFERFGIKIEGSAAVYDEFLDVIPMAFKN